MAEHAVYGGVLTKGQKGAQDRNDRMKEKMGEKDRFMDTNQPLQERVDESLGASKQKWEEIDKTRQNKKKPSSDDSSPENRNTIKLWWPEGGVPGKSESIQNVKIDDIKNYCQKHILSDSRGRRKPLRVPLIREVVKSKNNSAKWQRSLQAIDDLGEGYRGCFEGVPKYVRRPDGKLVSSAKHYAGKAMKKSPKFLANQGRFGKKGDAGSTSVSPDAEDDTSSALIGGSDGGSSSDTGSDTNTGSGSDTGSDTDTGSGSDTGSDTYTGSGSDTYTGSGSDTGSSSDSGTGSDTGSDTYTGSGSDTDTGSGTNSDSDSDSDSDSGIDSKSGINSDSTPSDDENSSDSNGDSGSVSSASSSVTPSSYSPKLAW